MPTKKKRKTLKIFGETWYQTRDAAAKTKLLKPLGYRAFNAVLCSITFYLLSQYQFVIQEFRLTVNVSTGSVRDIFDTSQKYEEIKYQRAIYMYFERII